MNVLFSKGANVNGLPIKIFSYLLMHTGVSLVLLGQILLSRDDSEKLGELSQIPELEKKKVIGDTSQRKIVPAMKVHKKVRNKKRGNPSLYLAYVNPRM